MTAPKRAEVEAAGDILRSLLAKAQAGEIEASSRRDKALIARLEGALLGLDVLSGSWLPGRPKQA